LIWADGEIYTGLTTPRGVIGFFPYKGNRTLDAEAAPRIHEKDED
jgi:hypothetical protein